MTTQYRVSDGNAHVPAETREQAMEIAESWIDSGDWEPEAETWWTTVHVYDDEAGEKIHEVEHQIDPEEPECDGEGHEWRDLGTWGHGGGVVVRDRCLHCGWQRVTNTWATRPDNGEQGLRSLAFERAEDEDE